jgi:hypothetical protein
MKLSTIIIYCILIYFFYIISRASRITQIITFILIVIICLFIEYHTYLKYQTKLNNTNKFLYLLIDAFHISMFIFMFILLCSFINVGCNLNYLFILNIFTLITILLFFYFKGCVISLLSYKIISNKFWVTPVDRLKYIVGIDKKYNVYRAPNNNEVNSWIKGQFLFYIPVLLINIFCFINKKKCYK